MEADFAYAQVFLELPSRLTGIMVRNWFATLGLLLLLGAMLALPERHFPGWWALIPTAGTALLLFSGQSAWINRTVLSNKALVFVGLISYPLYLWHWPILSFARLTIPHSSNDLVRIGLIAVGFFLAWLTYEFVERPIRFGHLRLHPQRWRLHSLASRCLWPRLWGCQPCSQKGCQAAFRLRYNGPEKTNSKRSQLIGKTPAWCRQGPAMSSPTVALTKRAAHRWYFSGRLSCSPFIPRIAPPPGSLPI